MYISRKEQKKSLLEFMESIVDTRDVYSTK